MKRSIMFMHATKKEKNRNDFFASRENRILTWNNMTSSALEAGTSHQEKHTIPLAVTQPYLQLAVKHELWTIMLSTRPNHQIMCSGPTSQDLVTMNKHKPAIAVAMRGQFLSDVEGLIN